MTTKIWLHHLHATSNGIRSELNLETNYLLDDLANDFVIKYNWPQRYVIYKRWRQDYN